MTVDGYLARDGSSLANARSSTAAIGIAGGDWATDACIAQQAVEAIGASHDS